MDHLIGAVRVVLTLCIALNIVPKEVRPSRVEGIGDACHVGSRYEILLRERDFANMN